MHPDSRAYPGVAEKITLIVQVILCLAGMASAILNVPGKSPAATGAAEAGWGVMTCLTFHVEMQDVARLLPTLDRAELTYVRELWVWGFGEPDHPKGDSLRILSELQKRRYKVLAVADQELKPKSSRHSLTEDLLEVYLAARKRAVSFGGLVNIWEMTNEADTGAIKDLPDRAVAYEKAMYLGLKDGMKERSAQGGVLMGALGNYPGPWLERAAENGLYDYTDGLNVHFYGKASDLAGVIHAQRAVAKRYLGDRELPVWITECGIDAVPSNDLVENRGREIQRQFTLDTAKTAFEEKVAAFFPFIFVWPGYSYAMVRRDGTSFPAWNAYAEYTRAHPLPARAAFAPPREVARVVPQWVPDESTCTPQKASGTYWFRDRGRDIEPIRGSLVFYNFSTVPVRGKVTVDVPEGFSMSVEDAGSAAQSEVEIPAMSSTRLGVRFSAGQEGYWRGSVAVKFTPEPVSSSGTGISKLVFGLETRPLARRLPLRTSISASCPPSNGFQWIWSPQPYVVTSEAGVWIGLNGVRLLNDPHSLDEFARFSVPAASADPRIPPMAITRVNGLNAYNSFLRVRTSPDSDEIVQTRVDLIDKKGQRFSILENFGKNPYRYQLDVTYLAFEDFQLYVFGRCLENPQFHPEDIREIQLRFYSVIRATTEVAMEVVSPQKPNLP